MLVNLLFACVAKATGAPFCFGKFGYGQPLRLLYTAYYYLCYPVAMVQRLHFVAQVYQYHFYFTPVITVNSAG